MNLAATKLGRTQRLPPPSPRYERGTLIVGKYRLEAQLGEGGMGTVWLARNETLDAPVALKLIRSGMQSEETVERLLLEARVEARLKHPNIVHVFDFGETDLGDAFIVMEVLDGISLGQLLTERPRLGAIEAVQIVLPVLAALCHAHENGVVHRDIKPENIFLDRGGLHAGTKLLDFGIAKLADDETHNHDTENGKLLGSPAYMAPEQAKGWENVDHRADIWAMCVVLYEAISGKPAFSGEGYVVLRNIIDEELLALEDTGAGEPALWRILSRGLKKDPAQRFQSSRELATALAQWLCDRGESEDLDGNGIARRWSVTPAPATASLPSSRSRRHVELFELPAASAEIFTPALRHPRKSHRAAAAQRAIAAAVFALVVVLAPSKTTSEPAMRASTGHAQRAAVADERLIELAQVAPDEPPVADARWTREAGPAKPTPQEPRYSKHSTPRITETALGLKVPY
jgi:serine/threonine protein kinase